MKNPFKAFRDIENHGVQFAIMCLILFGGLLIAGLVLVGITFIDGPRNHSTQQHKPACPCGEIHQTNK